MTSRHSFSVGCRSYEDDCRDPDPDLDPDPDSGPVVPGPDFQTLLWEGKGTDAVDDGVGEDESWESVGSAEAPGVGAVFFPRLPGVGLVAEAGGGTEEGGVRIVPVKPSVR